MNFLDSIILGAVQGFAEFIPISSSGHLIIAREILGWHTPTDLAYDAILQLATVLAVIVYFRKDLARLVHSVYKLVQGKEIDREEKNTILAIGIGTIPAIIFGLLLESSMETIFRSAYLVAVTLVAGSIVMIIAEKYAPQNQALTPLRGLTIGFFQCLALIPGFSRSGSTIAGGLFAGLSREAAARFSFLLSVPIILGSGLKKLIELVGNGGFSTDIGAILVGSITAFIVGFLAIDFLIKYLKKHTLYVFVAYRLVLAVVVFFVLL